MFDDIRQSNVSSNLTKDPEPVQIENRISTQRRPTKSIKSRRRTKGSRQTPRQNEDLLEKIMQAKNQIEDIFRNASSIHKTRSHISSIKSK